MGGITRSCDGWCAGRGVGRGLRQVGQVETVARKRRTPAKAFQPHAGVHDPLAIVDRLGSGFSLARRVSLGKVEPTCKLLLVGRARLRCPSISGPWLCPATSQPASQHRTAAPLPSDNFLRESSIHAFSLRECDGKIQSSGHLRNKGMSDNPCGIDGLRDHRVAL